MNHKLFKELKVATSSSIVLHNFIVDDNLVFFRATKDDCLQFRKCLQIYERASKKMVNYNKFVLTFRPSTSAQTMYDIKMLLSVDVVMGHKLYLGIPTFYLRNKHIQFTYLSEHICHKIQCCNSVFLSMGGPEVLIKSLLQGIPSYEMSCFWLPFGICQGINKHGLIFGGIINVEKTVCIG